MHANSRAKTEISFIMYERNIGRRFWIGNNDPNRQTVSVYAVHDGWLEFHYETPDGNIVRPGNAAVIKDFLPKIVEELPTLSLEQQKARCYVS